MSPEAWTAVATFVLAALGALAKWMQAVYARLASIDVHLQGNSEFKAEMKQDVATLFSRTNEHAEEIATVKVTVAAHDRELQSLRKR